MATSSNVLLIHKNQKNDKLAAFHLEKLLQRDGYISVADSNTAEIQLSIRYMEEQPWILVRGDSDILSRYAESMAVKSKTDALLVTDKEEDCTEYTLYRPLDHIKTTVRARGNPEEEAAAVNQACWQAAVCNNKEIDFSALFHTTSLSSEDRLTALGNCMGFDGASIIAGEELYAPDVTLNFAKCTDYTYITEGTPQMELAGFQNIPIVPEKEYSISFMNRGGPGTGLQIMLYGPFVQEDALTFTNVTLTHGGKEYLESSMYKTRLTNGWYAYVYDFTAVEITPGVSLYGLPNAACEHVCSEELWKFSAVPHGDSRYGLDVYFYVDPVESGGRGFTHTNCGIDCHEEWIAEYNSHTQVKLREEDFTY